jgi:ubiquinone biosynthesis protein Coq4
MIKARARTAFEAMTYEANGDAARLTAGLRVDMTRLGLCALAARMLSVAVITPERLIHFYDNAAAGWLSRQGVCARPPPRAPEPITLSEEFWTQFWALVETPAAKRMRLPFTISVARLSGLIPAEVTERVAQTALKFPGVRGAAAAGPARPFDLAALANCGSGSLGWEFYMQVLARQAELQILRDEDLHLDELPPPLGYLNARVMRCHGLSRIVAGYGVTSLDDVGASAFQLGQFGHLYSALFTAIVLTAAIFQREAYLSYVVDAVFMGWTHGRKTPLLLGADWEGLLPLPIGEARARLGVPPRSPKYDPLARARVLPGEH